VFAIILGDGVAAERSSSSTAHFGSDQRGMNRSVAPVDDFYRYANGRWIDRTDIPRDTDIVGTLSSPGDTARDRVRVLLELPAKNQGTPIGNFYASFTDESVVDTKGAALIESWLNAISQVPLHGESPPLIDGFSGYQNFYLCQAQLLRVTEREASLRNGLLDAPHTPAEQRVQEDRNIDSWHSAFEVKAGDKLYLPLDQRVHVW
jgi:predicted metalloendopeptidase